MSGRNNAGCIEGPVIVSVIVLFNFVLTDRFGNDGEISPRNTRCNDNRVGPVLDLLPAVRNNAVLENPSYENNREYLAYGMFAAPQPASPLRLQASPGCINVKPDESFWRTGFLVKRIQGNIDHDRSVDRYHT